MIGQLCLAQSFQTQIVLSVDVGIPVHDVLHKLLINHRICAGNRSLCLFQLHDERVLADRTSHRKRNDLAIQTQYAALHTERFSMIECQRHRAGFTGVHLAVRTIGAILSPVIVEVIRLLLVFFGNWFI